LQNQKLENPKQNNKVVWTILTHSRLFFGFPKTLFPSLFLFFLFFGFFMFGLKS
jgi:hypothetical protein